MSGFTSYPEDQFLSDEDVDETEEFSCNPLSRAEEGFKVTKTEFKGKLQNLELNTNKAGMEGLDTAKINEIIQKASEGSKFYHHKQKCQQKLDAKISQMKSQIEHFSEDQIRKSEDKMTNSGFEMELSRDLSKTIVHIDMDMFYAAVEMREDPSLRDKPMAVGSTSMLSTSNYAARKFGVRAAMPGFIAKKLCPDLVIVPCNFTKYREVSSQVQSVFENYDPQFCPMSLDEAYLDITDYIEANGHRYLEKDSTTTTAEAIVQEIRRKIEEKTQLTASAGIASNTRLAKVCSDMKKPNGQYYLPPDKEAIKNFVESLPIRKVSGIGNVTEQHLKALGVTTCSDLWTQRGLLRLLFSESSYECFLRVSLGLGSTQVVPATERDRKSISNETTFAGTSDRSVLAKLCADLCKDLEVDMKRHDLYGKIFTLKVKTIDFQIRTRAQSLLEYTRDEAVMASVAQKLLFTELDSGGPSKGQPLSLRLLGVRMSNLADKSQLSSKKQLTLTHLFSKSSNKDKKNTTNNISPHKQIDNSENEMKENPKINFDTQTSQNCNFESTSTRSCDLHSETKTDTIYNGEDDSLSDSDTHICDTASLNTEITSTSAKETTTSDLYTCPVCSKSKFNDVKLLNSHLDSCLSLNEVQKLVRETNSGLSKNSSQGSSHSSKKESKSKRKSSHNNNHNTNSNKRTKMNNTKSENTLHKYLTTS